MIFIFTSTIIKVNAQTCTLKGKITDAQDNSAVVGAGIMLKSTRDTLQKKGATTNLKGDFSFSNIKYGEYHTCPK